nr:1967_t:CDS:2 [Entrophospora candida]
MSLAIQVQKRDQTHQNYQSEKLRRTCQRILKEKSRLIDENLLISEIEKQLFDNISTSQINEILILTATNLLEKDPLYDNLAAGLLLQKLYREVFHQKVNADNFEKIYHKAFIHNLHEAAKMDITDSRLAEFDLEKLSQVLVPERDKLFKYLALNEKEREKRAIEFYQVMSNLRFISSTPTLLHSGLKRAQLSSCFLSTVNDDLNHIFKSYQDSANLLKYSGGVANDWSNVRAMGSLIKSINSETTGLIPFLKISNDVTHAINHSCNIRSPQDHVGVVNCSNLCTEITLNTSETETAVCNLGSINLAKHIIDGKLDENLFQQTITTAMRMLDNVIDLNYYPTAETKNSNLKHRPIGLGMMGFQDALFQLNINYNSLSALQFTDEITEKYSYYAISASSQLAQERGVYSSYSGSK